MASQRFPTALSDDSCSRPGPLLAANATEAFWKPGVEVLQARCRLGKVFVALSRVIVTNLKFRALSCDLIVSVRDDS